MTLKKLLSLFVFIVFVSPLHAMLRVRFDGGICFKKIVPAEDVDNWQIDGLEIEPKVESSEKIQESYYYSGWDIWAPKKDKLDEDFKVSLHQPSDYAITNQKKLTFEEFNAFNNAEMIEKIDTAIKYIYDYTKSSDTTELEKSKYNLSLDLLTLKLNSIKGTINGQTALHMALHMRLSQNQIKRLLQNGAKPFIKDRDGKFPIDLATIPEVIKLICDRMQEGVKKQRPYLQRVLAPKQLPADSPRFPDAVATQIAEYRYPMPLNQ